MEQARDAALADLAAARAEVERLNLRYAEAMRLADERLRWLDEAHAEADAAWIDRDSWVTTADTALADAAAKGAALARVEGLCDEWDAAKARCAASEDCDCSYKDCYEHGKWHNCSHGPSIAVRAALSGDQEQQADTGSAT